jgi:hypothetical protein
MTELITLKQRPIIEFSAMEARGLEVQKEIKEMNIPSIEATEENRSSMKRLRAKINKELKVFEDQRKMIHGKITQTYNEFNSSYKENIKIHYEQASVDLKEKIAEVESKMLAEKSASLNAYFDGKNEHDFITLDNVGLNIILSASDKNIKKSIDDFIDKVTGDIKAIETMDNSVRIKGYYQRTLDLNDSISSVNADIKREEQIEKERIEKEKADKERAEREAKEKQEREEREAKERAEKARRDAELAEERRIQAEKNAKTVKAKETQEAKERAEFEAEEARKRQAEAEEQQKAIEQKRLDQEAIDAEESKIYKMKFCVSGTKKQLKSIKEFMGDLGVDYE